MEFQKKKLNCSSKETVIDFIEKSDKYLLFNKHYTNLLINAAMDLMLFPFINADITSISLRVNLISFIISRSSTKLYNSQDNFPTYEFP